MSPRGSPLAAGTGNLGSPTAGSTSADLFNPPIVAGDTGLTAPCWFAGLGRGVLGDASENSGVGCSFHASSQSCRVPGSLLSSLAKASRTNCCHLFAVSLSASIRDPRWMYRWGFSARKNAARRVQPSNGIKMRLRGCLLLTWALGPQSSMPCRQTRGNTLPLPHALA